MKKIFDFYQFINESGDTFKYSFSFPVMKRFQLRDDGWSYDDLYTYLRNNGVDLKRDVAYEKGIEKREVSEEDIEEYAFNYGGKKMGGWDKFKTEYGLDFEEYEISRSDYRSLQDSFNNDKLEKYFQHDLYDYGGSLFELYNLMVVDPKTKVDDIDMVYGSFDTNKELNESEIKSIKDFISGQCSDGWGEGFEQRNETEKIQDLNFETSIHPWWSERNSRGRGWVVSINKI